MDLVIRGCQEWVCDRAEDEYQLSIGWDQWIGCQHKRLIRKQI